MILIGLINVGLGLTIYHAPQDPARIDVGVGRPLDMMPPSALPTVVVRAFVARYPHTIALGATHSGSSYVIAFPASSPQHHATFADNGAFLSED